MGFGMAALGGFGQGMANGLQTGMAMGRSAREAERFALERPRLEAEAQKAEAEVAYQKDFKEGMNALMQEAKGGEFTDADGNTVTKPPMDSLDLTTKTAELMKTTMFKHGLLDFKKMKEAADFTKDMEAEGVMDAMRYALANPNDQQGIKDIFNKKGKMKLGDDITIGVENGMFGPTVVGYKTGADGKQIKAFDGTEILMPFLSKETFAQIKAQERQTAVKEAGDTTRANIQANATLGAAGTHAAATRYSADKHLEGTLGAAEIRNRSADARGLVTPADQYKAYNSSFENMSSSLFRNPLPGVKPYETAALLADARALGMEYVNKTNMPPSEAASRAIREVFGKAGLLNKIK